MRDVHLSFIGVRLFEVPSTLLNEMNNLQLKNQVSEILSGIRFTLKTTRARNRGTAVLIQITGHTGSSKNNVISISMTGKKFTRESTRQNL